MLICSALPEITSALRTAYPRRFPAVSHGVMMAHNEGFSEQNQTLEALQRGLRDGVRGQDFRMLLQVLELHANGAEPLHAGQALQHAALSA